MTNPSLGRTALALLWVAVLLAGCATAPVKHRDPHDPWERMNRAVWKFDLALIRKVALPVDHAYRSVTPHFARVGLGNFFDNAGYPSVIVNDFLQAKLKTGCVDTGRFLVNSTVGIAGFLDPATHVGLAKNDNDFGRTLGTWGVPPGPYLVLPFLGTSDVRDFLGRVPDGYLAPASYINDIWIYLGVESVAALDLNSRTLVPTYNLLESQHPFDPYGLARNAYLQRRRFLIHGQSAQSEEQQEQELEKSLQDPPGEPNAPGSGSSAAPQPGSGAAPATSAGSRAKQ
ncbi:MAG: MlaA family lipoprotein [Steroidobacteraceae bacterium]